ncbi:MAG: insulinase family protein, partial [Magnetococcales bacterium]|nr:insulinase family protein [Magnetococcales bacterium]
VLANGLLVVSFPMPWLHEVGAVLYVRAGSRFEREEEAGIAHFLEHMFFKGTHRIPDATALHAALEAMAADMNAATGPESNAYWISLPPEHLERGFFTFCEMFTQPAFTGMDMERNVVLAEMREDENDQGEVINSSVLAGTRLWPGHPLSRSVLGNRESIERIQVGMLHDYMARHYLGNTMAVAFHGPIDHEEAVRLAQKALGGFPRGEAAKTTVPPAMPAGPHWLATNDKAAQLSLSLYFRTGGYAMPELHALSGIRRLLDDGFASRLQAIIREKLGLVYDIWATMSVTTDSGAFEVGASVSPANLPRVFLAILQALVDVESVPPGQEEWHRLMTRWRASLASTLDHPMELAERYVADRLFDSMESITTTWQQVAALSPQELSRVAGEVFRPQNMVVVLIGPQAKQNLGTLKSLLAKSAWGRPS